tara:strand:+ start:681 stop:1001 length:321 start_codon:yes stop_codon:yes gene_type:complete
MHYIIGTEIIVNERQTTAQSSRLRSVGAAQINRPVSTEYFKPGNIYTLYYIKRANDEKFLYTFQNKHDGEKFDMIFDSGNAADRYIAKILGERIPDYNKFYEKNKG